MTTRSPLPTLRFSSPAALAACVIGLAACNNAPWAKTKPAAEGSTASNPISADGSPATSPVGSAGAKPAQRVIPMGPFPAPWQGLWRGEGTDHMTDGSMVPFSMELEITADPSTQPPNPDRWLWSVRTDAEMMTGARSGELLVDDRASGSWTLVAGRSPARATFARGTLSVHLTEETMRESAIYRYGRDGDREYIDIERTIETPRAAAGATPLGTSGLHPGAVLRARLWRVDLTPPEAGAQAQ
jgi:hypothetical protein